MKILTILLSLFLLVQAKECGEETAMQQSATPTEKMEKTSMTDLAGNYEVTQVGTKDYSAYDITINVELGKEPRISGRSACNQYSGSISNPEGKQLEIGMLLSTKMYCKETAEVEKDFTERLNQVVAYEKYDGVLALMDASGNAIIKAKPVTPKK